MTDRSIDACLQGSRRRGHEHREFALSTIATIGLLHERNSREQTALSEQLQTALHSRVLVEQAKGVLAARAQISVGEAFTLMRTHARRRGLRLTDVASAVVQGSIDVDALTST